MTHSLAMRSASPLSLEALRGKHDGFPLFLVNAARDPMHFPMSALVVLAAVERGETFSTSLPRW